MKQDRPVPVWYRFGTASFVVDFYALPTSASLEYIEYAGMLLPILIAYSRDADTDNA
jgi:hypothetical protein